MSTLMKYVQFHGTPQAVQLPRRLSIVSQAQPLCCDPNSAVRYQVRVAVHAELVVQHGGAPRAEDISTELISGMARHVYGEFMVPLQELEMTAIELGVEREMGPQIKAIMQCMQNAKTMDECAGQTKEPS